MLVPVACVCVCVWLTTIITAFFYPRAKFRITEENGAFPRGWVRSNVETSPLIWSLLILLFWSSCLKRKKKSSLIHPSCLFFTDATFTESLIHLPPPQWISLCQILLLSVYPVLLDVSCLSGVCDKRATWMSPQNELTECLWRKSFRASRRRRMS